MTASMALRFDAGVLRRGSDEAERARDEVELVVDDRACREPRATRCADRRSAPRRLQRRDGRQRVDLGRQRGVREDHSRRWPARAGRAGCSAASARGFVARADGPGSRLADTCAQRAPRAWPRRRPSRPRRSGVPSHDRSIRHAAPTAMKPRSATVSPMTTITVAQPIAVVGAAVDVAPHDSASR